MNLFIIAAVFNVAFCVFIFFYFKWHIKRRINVNELLSEYRDEVYRLNAEIDSITDRDARLVEDRINKLKAILEDTDKRISVYVRELERGRSSQALYTNLGRGIRAALNTDEEKVYESGDEEEISRLKDAPRPSDARPSAARPAPVKKDREILRFPVNEKKDEPAKRETRQNKQIRIQVEALVKEGLSVAEIASRLNITLSEADLAVNLFTMNRDRSKK